MKDRVAGMHMHARDRQWKMINDKWKMENGKSAVELSALKRKV
jgi:hypothetical protein